MVIIVTICVAIAWLVVGFFLAMKWEETKPSLNEVWVYIISLLLMPAVLLGAIVRQVFIEKWK